MVRFFPLLSAVGIGVVLIVLGVPLAIGRVAPNSVYGYRTAKTLGNAAVWYPANRYCGRAMVYAGVATVVLALGALELARAEGMSNGAVIASGLLIELVPLFLALVQSFRFVARL